MAQDQQQGVRYWESYPSAAHKMRILLTLDSNVYIRHMYSIEHLLAISELDDLFTYCHLLLPEVVERECHAEYSQKVVSGLGRGARPHELKATMSRIEKKLEKLAKKHFLEWRKRLRRIAQRVATTDEILRQAYERLMKKLPPCHERDETRDAIIWETVLSSRSPIFSDETRIFITDNPRDFPFDSNTVLGSEMKAAGILWFKSFADFQQWVAPIRPTPWEAGVKFATWYKKQDFSWLTTGRLEDELPSYLTSFTDYFDYDSEVIEVNLGRSEIVDEQKTEDGGYEAIVGEEWTFTTSYGVSTELRVGGSDGADFSVSEQLQASGNASLTRTLTFDSNRNLISNGVEFEAIDLEEEQEWDPHEAWLDSLADDQEPDV